MRSTTVSSVSRSCVTMNTVRPRSSTSERTIASNARAVIGSSPEVGSSRNSTSGSSARARAIAARLRMPPDSSLGIFRPASGSSPACASRRLTSGSSRPSGTSRVLGQRHRDVLRDRQRREQCAVLEHHAEAPARRIHLLFARIPDIGAEQADAAAVGRCRPIISRNSTDLPVPLPPISATSVPA